MFNFWKKNKKVEEVKVEKVEKKYDGKVYRGVWQVGEKIIIGAYLRDGSNCISTEKGVYNVERGVKKTQLANAITINNSWFIKTDSGLQALLVNVDAIEHGIECLQKDYCTLFVTGDEL